MKKLGCLFSATAALALMSGAASANTTSAIQTTSHMVFVSETTIPAEAGRELSLCHLVSDSRIMSVNVWREAGRYVLAENRCTAQNYIQITDSKLTMAKTAGWVPSNLPEKPTLSLSQTLGGFWGWFLIAPFGLLAFGKSMIGKRQPKIKPATRQMLDTLCHAVKCDGSLDDEELQMIQHMVATSSGQDVGLEKIRKIAKKSSANLALADYTKFVVKRSQEEKEAIIRNVLELVGTDGTFSEKQREFVGYLAHASQITHERVTQIFQSLTARPT